MDINKNTHYRQTYTLTKTLISKPVAYANILEVIRSSSMPIMIRFPLKHNLEKEKTWLNYYTSIILGKAHVGLRIQINLEIKAFLRD